jgi:hypothetical protein
MRPAISMRAELDPEFAQWLRKLPAQVQLRFQRRAMRQALGIFKRIATPLYRQHRTNLPRKHLDQSLAVVTRRYKSPRGVTLWGALGFRRGRVRSIGGVAPKADRIYSNEWAGWRAHFLERGFTATGSLRNGRQDDLGRLMQRISVRARVQRGEGKRIPGKLYLPKVFAAGRASAQAAFQHAVKELLRSGGKRIRGVPKPVLSAEIMGALR